MYLLLVAISGIAWTIVYVEAIRVGLRDKTYAMPLAALGLNFAWESIYAVNSLTSQISAQGVVNLVWACADLGLLYTVVRFGRSEFPDFVTPRIFFAACTLVLGASYAVQLLIIVEFGTHDGAGYSAFLQNVLMSGLFIAMFVARRGLRGQTLTIAIAKWLGTLAPTILFGVIFSSPLYLGLGIVCSVLDIVYIGLVVWARARPDALLPQSPETTRSHTGNDPALQY